MNASRHHLQPPLRRGLTAVTSTVLGAALAVAACGEGQAGTSSDVVRRDSAGIEIVSSDEPAWSEDERWRVETDDSLLDVGSASGPADQELYQVSALARLSDGRWVVANGGTNELRFYSPEGELVARAGSQGEGPGEFQRLSGLERLPGDSLLAWEAREPRVSVFGPGGEFVRTFRLEDTPTDLEGVEGLSLARSIPIGRFRGGSLLARSLQLMSGDDFSTGVISNKMVFLRYGPDGEFRRVLAALPGPERWMRVGEGAVEIRSLLFTTTPRSVLAGDRWYFASSDRYEIAARRPDGTVTRLVRRRHEPEEVTGDVVEARIEAWLEDVDDPAERADRREIYSDMPVPETFPAFDDLAVSRAGHLWVQNYRKPDEPPPPWSVFAPDGRWLGDVQLPEGFDPMWIDEEVVAGVWEDELEVEHLRAYRIVKP